MRNEFLSTLLSPIKGRFLYAVKMAKWRRRNKHNITTVNEYCPIDVVEVGKATYGKLNVHWYGKEEEKLTIGNYCSIADDVHFILGGEHDYHRLSTYPFSERVFSTGYEGICKGEIIVEDDVWIGYGAIILSGVTLGQGCVIAAGSIVTKDVPPYAVWILNKVVKYRFHKDIIEKLQGICLLDIDIEKYKKYVNMRIDSTNIDDIIGDLQQKGARV